MPTSVVPIHAIVSLLHAYNFIKVPPVNSVASPHVALFVLICKRTRLISGWEELTKKMPFSCFCWEDLPHHRPAVCPRQAKVLPWERWSQGAGDQEPQARTALEYTEEDGFASSFPVAPSANVCVPVCSVAVHSKDSRETQTFPDFPSPRLLFSYLFL